MYYKVTFKNWIDWSEPIFDNISREEQKVEEEKLKEFLINAESEENARQYAERFEGLETHAYERLGSIVIVSVANPKEIQLLSPLSIYEKYLNRKVGRGI